MPEILQRHSHPAVVHFAIALLMTSVALDLVGRLWPRANLKRTGYILLVLGALAAVLAYLTGPEDLARGVTRTVRVHETWARVTTLVFLVLAAWRLLLRGDLPSGKAIAAYLLLALVGVGALGYTGYLGGRMVYDEAVGVQRDGKFVAPPVRFNRGTRPPGAGS